MVKLLTEEDLDGLTREELHMVVVENWVGAYTEAVRRFNEITDTLRFLEHNIPEEVLHATN